MVKSGFSYLSHHAELRLRERSKLQKGELLAVLNTDSFINLGCEIGFYKQHCLLFSSIDNQYYVAVQDTKSGKVVTFLPLEYHLQLSWKLKETYLTIDDEVLRRAKLIAKYPLTQTDSPTKISLKIRYIDRQGTLKTRVIKKFKADIWNYDPAKLILEHQKIKNLINHWKKKNNIKELIDVFTSMGRESKPHFLEDNTIVELNA